MITNTLIQFKNNLRRLHYSKYITIPKKRDSYEKDPLMLHLMLDALYAKRYRAGLDINVSKTQYTVFFKNTRVYMY